MSNLPSDFKGEASFEKAVVIKAALGIKIMIDASHNNENTTKDTSTYKDNLKLVTTQLQQEGYFVTENTSPITAAALNSVNVLMFTHPAVALTQQESDAIAAFVKAGGSLLLTEKSNFNTSPAISNSLLQNLGSSIRVTDDGIFDTSEDGNFWSGDKNANSHAVRLHPGLVDNYLTDRALTVEYFSGSSLEKAGNLALTDSDTVKVLVKGNETTFQNNMKNNSFVYDNTNDD